MPANALFYKLFQAFPELVHTHSFHRNHQHMYGNTVQLYTSCPVNHKQSDASFLVKDLQLNWRAGAAWFEHLLMEYDVASNRGNWAYQAGVGTDTRDRWFNVVEQSRRYDPKAD
ncbi:MAG: hypothetical protein KKC01_05475 [Gammaproteobacteria bacterium]|nr:hypothetical protein [Gammaproteobacteria bacterium]